MDRDRIARAKRRQEALDALEYEQTREEALRDRLAQSVADADGWRADHFAFERLQPAHVAALREIGFDAAEPGYDARERFEDEIREAEAELATTRLRREALERYLAVLGDSEDPLPLTRHRDDENRGDV